MSVDFIGFVGWQDQSESRAASGPIVDIDYITRFSQAHEAAGFDRVLVAVNSAMPDAMLISAHIGSVTEKLGLMVAHRPGFMAPTMAARQLATLDHFTNGRAAVHIITGGEDSEMRKDGDHLGKDERYARTEEYLDVMKAEWTATRPFDHHGKYYSVERGFSAVKSLKGPHIPVYFGGISDAAIRVAGKHADIYALWGETKDQVRATLNKVRAAAASHGRTLRFSLSFRPILAATEEAAWKRADAIAEKTKALRVKQGLKVADHNPQAIGAQKLLAAARQGTRLERHLFTGVAAVTGAQANSIGLVGTGEQIAEVLMEYYDLGVTTFLIRGFDPFDDVVDYGKNLIPQVRALAARRASVPAD
jgi:alkanesulfonate monooxygenase